VGGEVSIDTSSVPGDPEATMQKARDVRRAALAPASPSAQDQMVAAKAAQMEAEARTEKLREERQEREGHAEGPTLAVAAGPDAAGPEPVASDPPDPDRPHTPAHGDEATLSRSRSPDRAPQPEPDARRGPLGAYAAVDAALQRQWPGSAFHAVF
jgi:hypothetical protein